MNLIRKGHKMVSFFLLLPSALSLGPEAFFTPSAYCGIWKGKIGARPGLFSLGDMTGYILLNNLAGP